MSSIFDNGGMADINKKLKELEQAKSQRIADMPLDEDKKKDDEDEPYVTKGPGVPVIERDSSIRNNAGGYGSGGGGGGNSVSIGIGNRIVGMTRISADEANIVGAWRTEVVMRKSFILASADKQRALLDVLIQVADLPLPGNPQMTFNAVVTTGLAVVGRKPDGLWEATIRFVTPSMWSGATLVLDL